MPSGRPDRRHLRHAALQLLCALLTACSPAAFAHPGHDLTFDAQHTSAAFRVRLIWLQTVSGTFTDVEGGVHIDPLRHTAHVHADIRVASVRVHPAHYRERLLGSHFFDIQRYPVIRFQSRPLDVKALRHGGHLHGTLTMHGVTRPLTLQLSDTQCTDTSLDGCTLRLKGWLDRTHFGMHSYRALVSRRVRLDLTIRLRTGAPRTPTAAQGIHNG